MRMRRGIFICHLIVVHVGLEAGSKEIQNVRTLDVLVHRHHFVQIPVQPIEEARGEARVGRRLVQPAAEGRAQGLDLGEAARAHVQALQEPGLHNGSPLKI